MRTPETVAEDTLYDLSGKKVWVAGHRGLVGRAIVRRLTGEGCDILSADSESLDLRRQADVDTWVETNKPDAVFIAAAKVGGILANDTYPAEFLYDNLMMEANIIEASYRASVEKLLFMGSSCIYPKFADQPIIEDALLSGALEPTNEWYAIAKIAGLKLCEAYRRQYNCDFISAMPTNLYGPGDNFDLETSHVIPALIAKAHEAQINGAPHLTIWGTGMPRREFLYVDDLADGLVFLMKHYSNAQQVNVGTGKDVSILELAELVCATVGFKGDIIHDKTKPDGTPRKLLNVDSLKKLGWEAHTTLVDGLKSTYDWYAASVAA